CSTWDSSLSTLF
nr:immunoglobulin light chain junction region [Macaca mulatta]MPN65300.1 immunoglobulin light chain junction region [Macaca mulatta]MPN65356.1 immunoglobulin light chain junction region [Macaca mulatta]MPN65398.1 immunoglobulin light chain junction region [Macaca mulatta]MPN65512.1 immunoglobulin light chain junction region [Macaca mulatta]